MKVTLLDCTLRDGGYYNNWDFPIDLIADYLAAMGASRVDYVELGFRFIDSDGYKGACAYTRDSFIRRLPIPSGLKIGVMVNASDLHKYGQGPIAAAKRLFAPANESPVTLVRIACHVHEFLSTLPVCLWLKEAGYEVGINLMQIADRSDEEIVTLARAASAYPLDVLYFADSLGSLDPDQTAHIVKLLSSEWSGALGIHTHDNMGRAVANTARAVTEGATWIDGTVTGMGRGPGNARTEYLVLECDQARAYRGNHTKLLETIRKHFETIKNAHGWGPNPYYYLAGRYGIHPTFIQEMLSDARYEEFEILAVIDHLRQVGGKKYSLDALEMGRRMYSGEPGGSWSPAEFMDGRDVLILGAGPSVAEHRDGLEQFIEEARPIVIALNTQRGLDDKYIHLRAACHPFRLLADAVAYHDLPQPLVLPVTQIPASLQDELCNVETRDVGLVVSPGEFAFHDTHVVTPYPIVSAYAMAIATAGRARRILLAGFDGYSADDPRTSEMNEVFSLYQIADGALPVLSVTPTRYTIPTTSVYAPADAV